MIIECPSCLTNYETPAEIPLKGRNVRCAKCSHVWLVKPNDMPLPPEPADSELTVPSDGRAEPDDVAFREAGEDEQEADDEIGAAGPGVLEQDDRTETDAATEPQEDALQEDAALSGRSKPWLNPILKVSIREDAAQEDDDEAGANAVVELADEDEVAAIVGPEDRAAPPLSPALMAGWSALALAGVFIFVLSITQRVGIVRVLPKAASVYESVGLSVNVRGLDFENVRSAWTAEAGRLILEIHGGIINVTDEQQIVPKVVFALRNSDGLEVYQWAAEVRSTPLPAGERAQFTVRIPTPPKSIKFVQMKFAKAR